MSDLRSRLFLLERMRATATRWPTPEVTPRQWTMGLLVLLVVTVIKAWVIPRDPSTSSTIIFYVSSLLGGVICGIVGMLTLGRWFTTRANRPYLYNGYASDVLVHLGKGDEGHHALVSRVNNHIAGGLLDAMSIPMDLRQVQNLLTLIQGNGNLRTAQLLMLHLRLRLECDSIKNKSLRAVRDVLREKPR